MSQQSVSLAGEAQDVSPATTQCILEGTLDLHSGGSALNLNLPVWEAEAG